MTKFNKVKRKTAGLKVNRLIVARQSNTMLELYKER